MHGVHRPSRCCFACADLLNLEVDLLFFDTTSTYFERDEPECGDGAFRVFGHSKDHRPDLPQIVIGLAVTREGIPPVAPRTSRPSFETVWQSSSAG